LSRPQPSPSYAQSLRQFCDAVLADDAAVSIYRNNYHGAHINALHNTYLTVQHYLEQKLFSALALVYVQHYPPTRWDLNLYGEHFAELIAAQTQSAKADAADWHLLARLAQLEHAISRVYYGYVRDYESLSPYPQVLTHTQPVVQLQKQHPYTQIAADLILSQAITIRCGDTKIPIENSYAENNYAENGGGN